MGKLTTADKKADQSVSITLQPSKKLKMVQKTTKYHLHKRIARGGMAEIFIASKDLGGGKKSLCCVKRILPHYATDKEFIQMFRDEAIICQRFNHENIVSVSDFTEIDGAWAMVMELVVGSDLRAVFSACEKAKMRLTVPMACYIVAEAARGLDYAHKKVDDITQKKLGVVHRDISPQNIMVSFDGDTKVTDFGIAEADSKINETKPGIVKGKYSYMSPEQIMAKPVDPRTDVFALGIVLWEALAMKRLFQGANEVETIQLVKNCKISRKLTDLNPDVDPILNKIVHKALKKDLKERYSSCADLENDLRKYIASRYPNYSNKELSSLLNEVMEDKRKDFLQNIANAKASEKNASSNPPKGQNTSSGQIVPQPSAQNKQSATTRHIDAIENRLRAKKTLATDHTNHNTRQNPNQAKQTNHPLQVRDVGTQNQVGTSRQSRLSMQGKSMTKKNPSWSTRTNYIAERKSVSIGKSTLINIAAAVCLFIFSSGSYYLYLKSQPISQNLEIEFTPKRQLISLNGKLISSNHLESPIVIRDLKLGEHSLKFEREGFKETTFTTNLIGKSESKKITIALRRNQRLAPTELRLSSSSNADRLDYSFEQELEKGRLSSKRPIQIRDLLLGKNYLVSFSNGPVNFSCRFTPKSKTWTDPFIVVVYPEDKKCKTSRPR